MTSPPPEPEIGISLNVAVPDAITRYFYNRRVIPPWTSAHDKFERSLHAVINAFLDRRVGLIEAKDCYERKRILSEWRFEMSLARVHLGLGLDTLEARVAKREVEVGERAEEFWLEYSRDVKELEAGGL